MRAKNNSTAPSLTFPFAINLSKAGNKVEKADMHRIWNKVDMVNMDSKRFPKCSMTHF